MGGLEQRVVALLLVVCAAGCVRASADASATCSSELGAKKDAVRSCTGAYLATPSVDAAKRLVAAYDARGGERALVALLARNPVGPIGAEIWHRRGTKLRNVDLKASIAAFERALALRGSDSAGQIRELLALAERYSSQDLLHEELALRVRALDLAKTLGDPITLARVRVTISIALDGVGEMAAAERALGDSADVLPAGDQFLPPALLELGNIHKAAGRPKLAREALQRIMTMSDETARKDARWLLIDIALELGELDEVARLIETDPANGPNHTYYVARLAYARGQLDVAERTMATLRENRKNWMCPRYESFHGEVLMALGRRDEAIAVLSRSIAIFDEQLGNADVDEMKEWLQRTSDLRAPYEHLFTLYAREGRALEALGVAQRASSRSYLDGLVAHPPAPSSQDVATAVRAADARFEGLHLLASSVRTSAPAAIPPMDTLARELAGARVWTYFVADGTVWLIVLEDGTATVDDLGSVAAMKSVLAKTGSLDDAALRDLGERLAPPARWRALGPETVLHVVADRALANVPFAALVRDGQRWIEHTAIAYAPNATVLAALAKPRASDGGRVAMGDPSGDLPGARAETNSTAAFFGAVPMIGARATIQRFYDAKRADVLAVAAHAEATAEGARLRLADGDITPADIIDHHLAPGLVVLSSCSSASVDVDAWGAIAGAFVASGAPTVIASRWALDDRIGTMLVADFYRADGLAHPALALAVAQRHAIAQHFPVSAWAAMVALGTGERSLRSNEERVSHR